MKLRILSLAEADLLAGFRFYERQSSGVGAYFQDTLFSEIDSLLLYAGRHREVFGYYRMLSRRFPYAVYYRMTDEEITVWRVLDLRRDPQRIRERLLKSGGLRRPGRKS